MSQIDQAILDRANVWLNSHNVDAETKDKVKQLIDNEPSELTESFYGNLEFGTGGLRGIMGVGTNRMNRYTVGMATQGLANYLLKVYGINEEIRIAIAHDSRNNSRYFAEITADVLASNGMQVFLFDALRPTPELSFAVRYLKCQSGIVVTASHNPKEYNGYKVYWNDGAQLVPPHDKNVIIEVQAIKSLDEIKFGANKQNISIIGEEIDEAYLGKMVQYSLNPEAVAKHADMKIVYTPIHGTGITLVPKGMKRFGFNNLHIVEAQATPDGNFPTVQSPNPEEASALALAIQEAKNINADLVIATDPDADRIGIAVKDLDGNFILVNGNQTASLLTYYLVNQWKEKGKLKGNEMIVSTIVTSTLLGEMTRKAGIEYFDVLTGFKWIAEVIRNYEGEKTFIGGGEESYGFMIGDYVRDKDAIISSCMIAEIAAWAAEKGKSLFEILIDIYLEFGFYKEKLVNVVRKGLSGQAEIKAMMENFRNNPPKTIAGFNVVQLKDYQLQKATDLITGTQTPIDLPKSDVLQFYLSDGSRISVRPSGTEPKIKFYFGVKGKLNSKDEFKKVDAELEALVEQIITEMGLR